MRAADERASMSLAELAMYTGLSLRAAQRLKSGEEWLEWMRAEEGDAGAPRVGQERPSPPSSARPSAS